MNSKSAKVGTPSVEIFDNSSIVRFKDTLLQRSQALEEAQTAAKTAINKRRQIERLKASNNISAERVDQALEELEEVI